MIIKNIYKENYVNQGNCHDGDGYIRFRRILSDEFDSAISFLDYTIVPPGCSIGFHKHAESEEFYIIIEGSGLMRVDDEEITVTKGDVILAKKGNSHGLINNMVEDLEVLVVEGKF